MSIELPEHVRTNCNGINEFNITLWNMSGELFISECHGYRYTRGFHMGFAAGTGTGTRLLTQQKPVPVPVPVMVIQKLPYCVVTKYRLRAAQQSLLPHCHHHHKSM